MRERRSSKPNLPAGRRPFTDLNAEPEELSAEEMFADAVFARVALTPDGAEMLKIMRLLTIEKRNKPSDPDSALRHLEAQRMFVASIEARIARHWKRAEKPKG